MITEYIQAALRKAKYEFLPDDKVYFGEIPGFNGVYATSKNLETCREELREVLEEWILISVKNNLPIPKINNKNLQIKRVA
ncbi:MAG: type II toxin-antitoxin system HicB family antitoxin [Bacteroidia bacterium]